MRNLSKALVVLIVAIGLYVLIVASTPVSAGTTTYILYDDLTNEYFGDSLAALRASRATKANGGHSGRGDGSNPGKGRGKAPMIGSDNPNNAGR